MIRLLADENIPPALVGAIRQRIVGIDVETTHEAAIDGMCDPDLLAWAAERHRIVVTYDHRTMPAAASARISEAEPMPGVIVLHSGYTLRHLLNELELVIGCLAESDLRNQVLHLPLS